MHLKMYRAVPWSQSRTACIQGAPHTRLDRPAANCPRAAPLPAGASLELRSLSLHLRALPGVSEPSAPRTPPADFLTGLAWVPAFQLLPGARILLSDVDVVLPAAGYAEFLQALCGTSWSFSDGIAWVSGGCTHARAAALGSCHRCHRRWLSGACACGALQARARTALRAWGSAAAIHMHGRRRCMHECAPSSCAARALPMQPVACMYAFGCFQLLP